MSGLSCWLQPPAPQLQSLCASCVILGKFLNLSELIFLIHVMEIIMGILFK